MMCNRDKSFLALLMLSREPGKLHFIYQDDASQVLAKE